MKTIDYVQYMKFVGNKSTSLKKVCASAIKKRWTNLSTEYQVTNLSLDFHEVVIVIITTSHVAQTPTVIGVLRPADMKW